METNSKQLSDKKCILSRFIMEKLFLNKSLGLVVLTGIFASSIIFMHFRKKKKKKEKILKYCRI